MRFDLDYLVTHAADDTNTYYAEKQPPLSEKLRLLYENFYEGLSEKVIALSIYLLGDGLFGFATQYPRAAHILDSLRGEGKERTIEHELFHLRNWGASEYWTRVQTRTLDFEPNKIVSVY